MDSVNQDIHPENPCVRQVPRVKWGVYCWIPGTKYMLRLLAVFSMESHTRHDSSIFSVSVTSRASRSLPMDLEDVINFCRAFHGPTLVGRPGVGPPARPAIKFSPYGPRPGPAHQFFIWWAAARPGPSNFQRMGRGPAQPITFSKIHGPARPGQRHSQFFRPGPANDMAARPIKHGLIRAGTTFWWASP